MGSNQKGFLALQVVTANCHGVLNTVLTSPTQPPPSWFAGLYANLQTAQTDAGNWVQNLAPQMTSNIPNVIMNTSSLFQAGAQQIASLLSQAGQPGSSEQDLLNQAIQVVQALQQQVQANKATIDGMSTQLTEFSSQLQTDHDALESGTTSIQSALSADQTDIANMNANITNLQASIRYANQQLMASEISTSVGIFILVTGLALTVGTLGTGSMAGALVMGAGVATLAGGAAGWGVWESQIKNDYDQIAADQSEINADNQQIVALSALAASVDNAVTCISDASQSVSEVMTLWDTFDDLCADVLNDLGNEQADITKIGWDKLWLASAQNNWIDLQNFAQQLLNTGVTVDSKSLSLPQPAALVVA